MISPLQSPRVSPIKAGLACRCPRCGRGRLFDGFLTVAESCGVCAADLTKSDSGDGPAVFIVFIMGAILVPLALWLEAAAAPPMWVHVILWSVIALAGSLALLRPLKGVMIALQYHHRASDSGHMDYGD